MSRYKNPNFIEDEYAEILTHKDMLSIAEEASDMYSNYRALDIQKPRGCTLFYSGGAIYGPKLFFLMFGMAKLLKLYCSSLVDLLFAART